MESPDPIYVLRGSCSPVTSLLYQRPTIDINCTSTTPVLLSGTQTGKVHIWNLTTWRSVSVTDAHAATVLSIQAHHTNPNVIFTQGRDGWIHTWDIESSLRNIDSLQTPNPAFCSTAFVTLANEDIAVLPTDNQSQVNLVSIKAKRTVMKLDPKLSGRKHGMCMQILAVKDSTHLLIGYEDGSISYWDARMESTELDNMKFHEESLMAFDYHSTANRGLSGSVNNILVAWTLKPSGEFTKLRDVSISGDGIACVRYRHDGKFVVVGGWDGRIRAFSAKRQSPLVVLDQHKQTVQCAAFSPGGMLAVGSKDKHISVWNIYT